MGVYCALLLLCFLLTRIERALADIQFIFPQASSTVVGGAIFNVTFGEKGNTPALTQLSTYVIAMYSGSNRQPVQITTFPPVTGTYDPKYGLQTATFQPINLNGPTAPNAYFLGINSTLLSDPSITVINFSRRFTISGQDGQASAAVNDGNAETVGTDGPERYFACGGVFCIPPPSAVELPDLAPSPAPTSAPAPSSSPSRSPSPSPSASTTTPKCSNITSPACPPPIPQMIPETLGTGIGAYLGVMIFIGVFVVIIIVAVIAAFRLERRRRQPSQGSSKNWWNKTPPGGSIDLEKEELKIAPLKIIKKEKERRSREQLGSGEYDGAWLAQLEISRPRSVYGQSDANLQRFGDGRDSRTFEEPGWDERRGSVESLSTIVEMDEKELPTPSMMGGKEKREGRVFDERTRSRYYSMGAV